MADTGRQTLSVLSGTHKTFREAVHNYAVSRARVTNAQQCFKTLFWDILFGKLKEKTTLSFTLLNYDYLRDCKNLYIALPAFTAVP